MADLIFWLGGKGRKEKDITWGGGRGEGEGREEGRRRRERGEGRKDTLKYHVSCGNWSTVRVYPNSPFSRDRRVVYIRRARAHENVAREGRGACERDGAVPRADLYAS